MNDWKPISEYQPSFGRVVVWLSWTEYARAGGLWTHQGEFQAAYTIDCGGNPVWVEATSSIPIEAGSRRVTHFMQPSVPTQEGHKP